ncbi:MAG: DNA methyltransferase, partial [Thermoplasmatales archaeon]
MRSTGSIFVHCDYHAGHYIKVELDKIFGFSNFRDEIIWKRTSAHGTHQRAAGNVHDIILHYTRTNNYTFNQVYTAHDEKYVKSHYNMKSSEGRIFMADNLIAPNKGYRYTWNGVTKGWRLP